MLLILISICFSQTTSEAAEITEDTCGAIALSTCLTRIGMHRTVDWIDSTIGRKGSRTTLADLQSLAESLGVTTVALRWSNRTPSFVEKAPAIMPVQFPGRRPHFVAVVGQRPDALLIVDFPRTTGWVKLSRIQSTFGWDGTLLHITDNPSVATQLRRSSTRPWTTILGAIIVAVIGVIAALKRKRSPTNRLRTSNRGGFTILELLVVMGVISLLIGLLLPAIQSSREAARQLQCLNNLKQIGIAAANSEAVTRAIPTAARFSRSRSGDTVAKNYSIHVGLLPFLDQQELYDRFDFDISAYRVLEDPPDLKEHNPLLFTRLPVFLCPSDPGMILRNSYRICTGTSPGHHETTDQPPVNQALRGFRWATGRRDPKITDGRSNTVAFSERVAGDGDHTRYSPWTDIRTLSVRQPLRTPNDVETACQWLSEPAPNHTSFSGSTWALAGLSQTWYNHILPPNSRITDCSDGGPESNGAYSARSYHQESVNVLFVDGSARSVGSAVDRQIWRALGTIAGDEVVDFQSK